MLLGRFLEVSLHAPELLESLGFYERLGLTQAVAGDIWEHGYGVVSDGTVAFGLHAYEFPSPALVWVRPQLAESARQLEARDIPLEFIKMGEDQFNELGFLDPDGQMITLLEARTFSPPSTPPPPPAAGFFREYRYPVRRLDEAIGFWESMGFVATEVSEGPGARAALTSDGIDLCVYESSRREPPELVFASTDLARTGEQLSGRDLAPATGEDAVSGGPCLTLRAPEGTSICILCEPI